MAVVGEIFSEIKFGAKTENTILKPEKPQIAKISTMSLKEGSNLLEIGEKTFLPDGVKKSYPEYSNYMQLQWRDFFLDGNFS